jgi:hypothetical protein
MQLLWRQLDEQSREFYNYGHLFYTTLTFSVKSFEKIIFPVFTHQLLLSRFSLLFLLPFIFSK